MPIATIPLSFTPDQRGPIITSSSAPSKDARLVRCFNTVAGNDITGTKSAFLEKVPGWAVDSTPGGSNSGRGIYSSFSFLKISAFSNGTVYSSTTSMGVPGTGPTNFTEGLLNNQPTLFFTAGGSSGWFLPKDAMSGLTFTADTTNLSPTLANVSSLTGLYVGQLLAGTGIQALARIQSITSPSTVTMTLDATATNSGVTITREAVAKIIDADFIIPIGLMVELNGRVFSLGFNASAGTDVVQLGQSALNDASSWGEVTTLSEAAGAPGSLIRSGNTIIAFCAGAIKFYKNDGNASGLVLTEIQEAGKMGIGSIYPGAGTAPVCVLGGVIYWLCTIDGVFAGVYRLNGVTPEPITPPSITRQLAAVFTALGESVYAFDPFTRGGNSFLYVGQGDIGYEYCVETKQWGEAGYFSGGMRIHGTIAEDGLYGVRMTGGTGKIYEMKASTLTYQDDSAAYTMTAQTRPYYLNKGRPFFINSARLLADTQASGTTTFSTSGDDYASFDTMEAFDMTAHEKVSQPCGRYQTHAIFKLEHAANTAWRGEALEVEWEPA